MRRAESAKLKGEKMLLAIDIGNTTITFGLFRKERLIRQWWVRSGQISVNLFRKGILKSERLSAIIISSVAPKTLTKLRKKLINHFRIKPLIVGKDITIKILNLYHDPKQVGSDRLVNAVAGYKFYGGPLVIVDFGTAITFDVISAKGAYLGGIIAPGVKTSLDALSEKAALLPRISLSRPKSLVGKETSQSMNSGIIYGFSALCDGIICRLKKKYGSNIGIVATGGEARNIAAYCKSINIKKIRPDLTLQGLRLIYQNYLQDKNS